jgi:hypothetical protein
MNHPATTQIRPFAPGIVLALLSILFGFLLGGAFGAVEDSLKGRLRSSADTVGESVYRGDTEKRDAVVQKSWAYMKRAHLHGGAIGSAALASILLMALMGSPGVLEKGAAAAFGAGALLYSLFWLAAGLSAPALGSTDDAKEGLAYLAIPGAGLSILGLIGTLVSTLKSVFTSSKPPHREASP